MPLLTSEEAFNVSDSFLWSLYGDDLFRRWKELKDEMQFIKEKEFVGWLIDVANHYKNNGEFTNQQEQQGMHGGDATHTVHPSFRNDTVKVELDLEYVSSRQKPPKQYETNLSNVIQDKEYTASPSIRPTSIKDEAECSNCGQEEVLDSSNLNEQIDKRPDVNMESEEILLSSGDDEDYDDAHNLASDCADNYNMTSADLTLSTTPKYSAKSSPIAEYHPASGLKIKYKCPHCSYHSIHRIDVNRHIMGIHERRKPFTCDYCDHSCTVKQSLKGHLISKHGFTSKHRCLMCGKYFPTPTMLFRHVKSCNDN